MEIKKNAQLVKILKQNGIDVHDYSSGIKIKNKKTKQKNCFSDLVQGDIKLNLKKLHNRIDGHGGKDVAAILLRAKEDAMISRLPTKAEFNSEFSAAIGVWRSISTYLNPNKLVDYSSVRL